MPSFYANETQCGWQNQEKTEWTEHKSCSMKKISTYRIYSGCFLWNIQEIKDWNRLESKMLSTRSMRRTPYFYTLCSAAAAAVDVHCALFLPALIRIFYFSLRNFLSRIHNISAPFLILISSLCVSWNSFNYVWRFSHCCEWHGTPCAHTQMLARIFFCLGQDLLQSLTYRERIFGIASIVAPHTTLNYTSPNEII